MASARCAPHLQLLDPVSAFPCAAAAAAALCTSKADELAAPMGLMMNPVGPS